MENVHIKIEKLYGLSYDNTRKRKNRPGYYHSDVHIIFDIEMGEIFTIKAILLSDGHSTTPSHTQLLCLDRALLLHSYLHS